MKTVIEILKAIVPEVDENNCHTLLDDGIIDSLDIVRLVANLEAEFQIVIQASDIITENFNSIISIESLVNMRKNQ